MSEFSKDCDVAGDLHVKNNGIFDKTLRALDATFTRARASNWFVDDNVLYNNVFKTSSKASTSTTAVLQFQNMSPAVTQLMYISNGTNLGTANYSTSQLSLFAMGADPSAVDQERIDLKIGQNGASLDYGANGVGSIRPLNVMNGSIFERGGKVSVSTLINVGPSNLNTLIVNGDTNLKDALHVLGKTDFNNTVDFRNDKCNFNSTLLTFANNITASTFANTTDRTNFLRFRNTDASVGPNFVASFANTSTANTSAYQTQLSLYALGSPDQNTTLASTEVLHVGVNSVGGYLRHVIRDSNGNIVTTTPKDIDVNSGALFSYGGSLSLLGSLNVKNKTTTLSDVIITGALSAVIGNTTLLSATINNDLNVNGNINCIKSLTTAILTANGATTLNSTLDAKGIGHFYSDVSIDGLLSITNAYATGSLNVKGTTSLQSDVTALKNVTVGQTLTADSITFNTSLIAQGTSTLKNVSISGTTTMMQNVTVTATKDVDATLANNVALFTAGGLYVTKNIFGNSNLTVTGNSNLGNVTILQQLTLTNGGIQYPSTFLTTAITRTDLGSNLFRLRANDSTNRNVIYSIGNNGPSTVAYDSKLILYGLGTEEISTGNYERLEMGANASGGYLTHVANGTGAARPININNGSIFATGGNATLATLQLSSTSDTALNSIGGASLKSLLVSNNIGVNGNINMTSTAATLSFIAQNLTIKGATIGTNVVQGGASNTTNVFALRNTDTTNTSLGWTMAHASTSNAYMTHLSLYALGNPENSAINSNTERLQLGVTGATAYLTYLTLGNGMLRPLNIYNGAIFTDGGALSLNSASDINLTSPSVTSLFTAGGLYVTKQLYCGGGFVNNALMMNTAVNNIATSQGGSPFSANVVRYRTNDSVNASLRISLANTGMGTNYYDSGITFFNLGTDASTNSERLVFGANATGGYLNYVVAGNGTAKPFNLYNGAVFTSGGALALSGVLNANNSINLIGNLAWSNLLTTNAMALTMPILQGGANISANGLRIRSNDTTTTNVRLLLANGANSTTYYDAGLTLYALGSDTTSNFERLAFGVNATGGYLNHLFGGTGTAKPFNLMNGAVFSSGGNVSLGGTLSVTGASSLGGVATSVNQTPTTGPSTGAITVPNGGIGANQVWTNTLFTSSPMTAIWYSQTTATRVSNRTITSMAVPWTLQASTSPDLTNLFAASGSSTNQYTILWPGTYCISFTVRFTCTTANSTIESWLNCANSAFYGTTNTRLGKEGITCGTLTVSCGATWTGYFQANDVITPQVFLVLGGTSLTQSTINTGTDCTTSITCLMRHG